MPLIDRRDMMTLPDLVAELEVSYPEKFNSFESRHPEAMLAVVEDEIESPEDADDEELREALDDLREDVCSLLRI